MIVPAVYAVERNGGSILTPLEVMLLAAIGAAVFVAVERLVPMIAGTLSRLPVMRRIDGHGSSPPSQRRGSPSAHPTIPDNPIFADVLQAAAAVWLASKPSLALSAMVYRANGSDKRMSALWPEGQGGLENMPVLQGESAGPGKDGTCCCGCTGCT